MAINQENSAGVAAAGADQQTDEGQFGRAAPQGAKRSAGNFAQAFASIGGNYVARGSGGDYLIKIRKSFEESAKRQLPNLAANFLTVNRQEHTNLKFSVLIMTLSDADTVAYHALLLEGTGEDLKPEPIQIDNGQIFVNRVTSSAFDHLMLDLIEDTVHRNFPNAIVLGAGQQVVYRTVDPEDTGMIEGIIYNAGQACVSKALQATDSLEPLLLKEFGNSSRLVIDVGVNTGRNTIYDAAGNAVRADVQLAMSITSAEDRRRSVQQILDTVNSSNTSMPIANVFGFVNTLWSPDQHKEMFNARRQEFEPKLSAEFVITGIETAAAISPASVLLGASGVFTLSDKNRWAQALISNVATDPADPKCLGVLNVLTDTYNENIDRVFGRELDMGEIAGDYQALSTFLEERYHEGMLVSIDCGESMINSWVTDFFVRCALGDQDARNDIIRFADELTDGYVGDNIGNAPIFSNIIRVTGGHYTVKNEKRDLRDVDLVYIANAFKNNPADILEYISTFSPRAGYSEPTLLARREGHIKHALRDQATLDNYYRRCTFATPFLEVFSRGLELVNVNTAVNAPLAIDTFQRGALVPQYISGSRISGTNTFAGRAYGQETNSAMFGHSQFRRGR